MTLIQKMLQITHSMVTLLRNFLCLEILVQAFSYSHCVTGITGRMIMRWQTQLSLYFVQFCRCTGVRHRVLNAFKGVSWGSPKQELQRWHLEYRSAVSLQTGIPKVIYRLGSVQNFHSASGTSQHCLHRHNLTKTFLAIIIRFIRWLMFGTEKIMDAST